MTTATRPTDYQSARASASVHNNDDGNARRSVAKRPTQVDKLLIYLANNPGASARDIIDATGICKYTSRISDARDKGHTIACRKRDDGQDGYWIMPRRAAVVGEQQGMGL